VLKRTAFYLLINVVLLFPILVGCNSSPITTTFIIPPTPEVSWPSPTATLPSGQEPVVIVSVTSSIPVYDGTTSPGGPVGVITLKNVGEEPIIYLNVALNPEDYPAGMILYDVTPSQPLLPGKTTEARFTFGPTNYSGKLYPLKINGTLQSLVGFEYTKQVSF
jgi:hypothetical protein